MAQMADDELEPLITECPSCGTRFRASDTQLQRARGKVRCGACLTVFDGVAHLTVESAQAFADEDQARRALDDVLDELAGEAGAEEPQPGDSAAGESPRSDPRRSGSGAPGGRGAPNPPIFGGFEGAEGEDDAAPAPETEDAAEGLEDVPTRFEVVGDDVPDESSVGVASDAPAVGAASDAPSVGAASPPRTADAPEAAASTAGAPAASRRERPALRDAETQPNSPSASRKAATTTAGPGEAAPVRGPAAEPARPESGARQPFAFGERPARRPLVWAAIAAGIGMLAVQVLWYQFDDWAKDPQWRGTYAVICSVIGCELPQQFDRSKLVTRNLAVRTHPQQPGSLQVRAMIVNEAEFPQAFPVLELRFTAVSGHLVAGRRFEPEDYLEGDATGMELIPPRTPVQIELTVEDPGPQAVNYFLRFR